jgi:8-oxo-dGTP pyrophosphatase MutT (NUDIX family)
MSTAARQLMEALRTHVPADATEERHLRAIQGHLVHAKSPLSPHKYSPGHVTASLYIVHPATRRILLHRHRGLDRWLQMGGHLEPNESPAAAALREGREESGLADLELLCAGILDVDVHGIPADDERPAHFHFDVRYAARTATPDAIARNAAESLDLAWMDLERARDAMGDAGSTRALGKIAALLEAAPRAPRRR